MDESEALEAQFAGCLLMVGPPDAIGMGGIEGVDWRKTDVPMIGGQVAGSAARVTELLDGPVSTMAYRYRCLVWWGDHAVERPYIESFSSWWYAYKIWLLENHRGD